MDRTLGPIRKRPSQPAFDPSAAKGWVKFAIDGTINASFNVASVDDDGVGDWGVNWTTAFSSADYAVVPSAFNAPGEDTGVIVFPDAQSAGAVEISCINENTTQTVDDPTAGIFVIAFGDQ